MTHTERMPNTEAAAYIEDDPEAWAAWLDALGRFVPFHESLTDHFRTHVMADSVLGGSILAYLADKYGLYLLRVRSRRCDYDCDACRDAEANPEEAGLT